MEIRQLRYFVAITETNSFSEASRRCFISQSAISQQIKLLEEEFKTTLLNRSSHKVSLTESGERFLPLARRILENVNQCQNQMEDLGKTLQGTLNIGATYALEPYVRRASLLFIKLHPNVQVNMHFETIANMMKTLRNGELDMAFSILANSESENVSSEPLTEYRLCAIMSDTHPLSQRESISINDLRNYGMILPEEGVNGSNAIQEYLCDAATGLKIRVTVNNPHTLLNMVKQSRCISILSEGQAKGDPELRAIPIDEFPESVTTYLHLPRGVYSKRSVPAFLKILRDQF